MRLFTWIALLSFGLALLGFSGCNGDDDVTGVTVSGTVTNAVTGTLTPGVSLALLSDGVPIRTAITNVAGAFSFLNVPAGTYTIRATGFEDSPAATLFGPITVSSVPVTGIALRVASLPQLGFVNPINNTATLLAFGRDAANNPIDVTAAVDSLLSPMPGNPAVITDIPTGTYNVAVANPATSQNVLFRNVLLQTNTVVVVNARFSVPSMAVSFSGTVTDYPSGTLLPGASVQLLQDGTPVGSPVITGMAGEFTLTDVTPAADYTLRISSPTGAFLTTYYTPIAILETSTGNVINVATAATLDVEPPTDGTAALVAYGLDADDNVIPANVSLNGGAAFGPGSPLLLGLISPGTHTVTVIDAENAANAVTISNVPFVANTVLVFRARVR